MQKKIIAAALAILAFACLATACGEEEQTYTPVEYTTDAEGGRYVTNVYGDLIPVTTDTDGSMELLEDLYTKTAEQVQEDVERLEGATAGTTGSAQTNVPTSGSSGGETSETPGGGIEIGNASPDSEGGREAVIVW
ncbi:MAG TPA: hypothetical protein IAC53_07060 [Candidatus Fimenecus excrementigallinarum]|uniref:Uncharacterized protein n=1 Tax=Candidatus Fimenecus excrementigallinarum TaxID=2840816 RepID=A0A9D1LF34_9FIRM|nr:hypothetical protein [Candidatus Fimenecus excrementigallinarum]